MEPIACDESWMENCPSLLWRDSEMLRLLPCRSTQPLHQKTEAITVRREIWGREAVSKEGITPQITPRRDWVPYLSGFLGFPRWESKKFTWLQQTRDNLRGRGKDAARTSSHLVRPWETKECHPTKQMLWPVPLRKIFPVGPLGPRHGTFWGKGLVSHEVPARICFSHSFPPERQTKVRKGACILIKSTTILLQK